MYFQTSSCRNLHIQRIDIDALGTFLILPPQILSPYICDGCGRGSANLKGIGEIDYDS